MAVNSNLYQSIEKKSFTTTIKISIPRVLLFTALLFIILICPVSASYTNMVYNASNYNSEAWINSSYISNYGYADVMYVGGASGYYSGYSLYVGSSSSSLTSTNYITFLTDFSGTDYLRFHVKYGGTVDTSRNTGIGVYIDGVLYYSLPGTAAYHDSFNPIAVSHNLTGVHTVKIQSIDSSTSKNNYAFFSEIYTYSEQDYNLLPNSDGIIYFQQDPYTTVDTARLRYNQYIDYNDSGWHWMGWNLPTYYYNEYTILYISEGLYINESEPFQYVQDKFYAQPPYENNNAWQQYDFSLTSSDLEVIRGQLLKKRDYYAGIYGLYNYYIGSDTHVIDEDYAWHTASTEEGNLTVPMNPTIEAPEPPASNTSIPENPYIPPTYTPPYEEPTETPDEPVTIPDEPVEVPPTTTPPYTSPGVNTTDPVETLPPELPTLPDDNTNVSLPGEVPDLNGTVNITVPVVSQNQSEYSSISGYYSLVNSTFAPVDSMVSGVLFWGVSPVTSLTGSVTSLNVYASSTFTDATYSLMPASMLMTTVFSSMPDKVKGIVTYYLVLTLILLLFGRSW